MRNLNLFASCYSSHSTLLEFAGRFTDTGLSILHALRHISLLNLMGLIQFPSKEVVPKRYLFVFLLMNSLKFKYFPREAADIYSIGFCAVKLKRAYFKLITVVVVLKRSKLLNEGNHKSVRVNCRNHCHRVVKWMCTDYCFTITATIKLQFYHHHYWFIFLNFQNTALLKSKF